MHNWTNLDIIYIYDGSFEGLLTIVFKCFEEKVIPRDVALEDNSSPNFIDKYIKIETNLEKAHRVFNGILNIISDETLYIAHMAHLSGNSKKDINIVKYLIFGFIYGSKVNFMRDIDAVLNVQKIKRQVWLEAHRLKGLIRFRKINNNILYSDFEPDNNVIEELSRHFAARLKNENWILHDKKRNLVSVYNTREYMIIRDETLDFSNILNSEDEEIYQKLWKTFWRTIAIQERVNPRLQKSFMPKRYWKYLTEIEE